MIYYVLLFAALIFSIVASIKVKSTFNKYNGEGTSAYITSNQVVEEMFRANDIHDVSIQPISGSLTDNYNPSNKTLNLSESTFNNTSIAAIGVAAHEAGHSIQHHVRYPFLVLRSISVPVVNFCPKIGVILAVVGLFLSYASGYVSNLTTIGIVLYSFSFLFTLITLPVEFNASRRAIASIKSMGRFTDDEVRGMKKVLTAAAMTYVAAMFSSLVSLLRFIMIFGGGRRRK